MRGSRRWTLWASAGFVALVVIVALTAAITSWQVGDDSANIRHPAKREVTRSAGESCPSDASRQAPSTAPPEGVRWKPLSGDLRVMLPFSDRYGPCEITATTARGYAHTPRGALLAAAQIATRVSVPGEIGKETIEHQVVPGQWRDVMLSNLTKEDEESRKSGPPTAFAAFAINFSSDDSVRISLAVTHPQQAGTYYVFEVDMAWVDGDWRMHAPPGGDWNNAVTSHTRLTGGFVSWGPE